MSRSTENTPNSSGEHNPGGWIRLEELVRKLSVTGRSREPSELREFWQRYRSATSRLARLQAEDPTGEEAFYLNRLVASAHGVLYRDRSRSSGWRSLGAFFLRGWPALVREHAPWIALSAGLFAIGGLIGAFYGAHSAGFVGMIASPDVLSAIDRGEMWTHGILSVQPAASSFIFSNNASVAIVAFALGVTAGLGTAWILLSNGVALGALAVAVDGANMSAEFWGFVVAHGVLELPAIFIAGAAGLILGHGMLFPRDRTRSRATRDAARVAVRLLAGCAPLLLVAAAIEAYVSPVSLSLSGKLAIAAAVAACLGAYVALPRQTRFSERTRR